MGISMVVGLPKKVSLKASKSWKEMFYQMGLVSSFGSLASKEAKDSQWDHRW